MEDVPALERKFQPLHDQADLAVPGSGGTGRTAELPRPAPLCADEIAAKATARTRSNAALLKMLPWIAPCAAHPLERPYESSQPVFPRIQRLSTQRWVTAVHDFLPEVTGSAPLSSVRQPPDWLGGRLHGQRHVGSATTGMPVRIAAACGDYVPPCCPAASIHSRVRASSRS